MINKVFLPVLALACVTAMPSQQKRQIPAASWDRPGAARPATADTAPRRYLPPYFQAEQSQRLLRRHQPVIRSKAEFEGLQAIFDAAGDKARIVAVDTFVEKFPDSEWKGFALHMGAISYQQMNDYKNLMTYGERALEVEPDNCHVMLVMSTALARRNRESGFDKEEELNRAAELANRAIKILANAPRPNVTISDDQWEAARKDLISQAHEALGIIASNRKNYEEAVDEYKQSIELNTNPVPVTQVRLGAAYIEVGDYGEAIVTLEAALADPQLQGQARTLAEQQKARAQKMQAGQVSK